MIKISALFGKRPEWQEADFVAHYLERHAPLVAGTAGFKRFCTKYVQNIRIDPGPEFPFDTVPARQGAITELWFRDPENVAEAYAAPDYLERVRPDEQRFVAFDSANVLLCRERQLWTAQLDCPQDLAWARAPRIRLFVFRAPRDARTDSGLQETWRTESAYMVGLPAFQTHVRGYTQSLVIPGAAADLPQVANNRTALIEEFRFATVLDASRFWAAALDDARLRTLWAEWTDLSGAPLFLARAHTVFEPE
jgi:hypothetical protein